MATAVDTTPKAVPINNQRMAAGYVSPYVGRVAQADVAGLFGLSLIRKGEVVTQAIADRAQSMGRLFELIAATEAKG